MSSDIPLPAVYVAGLNQSKKLIKGGSARKAFAATDAEEKLVSVLKDLCSDAEIELDCTKTMEELGKLCEIDVGCAVCVVLK
ncbi:MAG TPA: 50S ribosomal protein L7ae-like protein [Clostridiales bacterium]|nr:50S ribosomal protein L7ae-like protein [Candidatus Apopatosoma intestinale]